MIMEIANASIYPLITCICSVILGTYVYALEHKHVANKIFILFMGSMAIMTFLDFIQAISTIESYALLFAKLKYAILLFIPSLFLHLSSVLSDNKKMISYGKFIFILYVTCIIFFIFTISTNLVISGVVYQNNTYSTNNGFLIPFLMLFAMVFLIIGLFILIITFKATKNINKKIQLKYIFYGMSITGLLMLLIYQILPIFSDIVIQGSIIFALPMFVFFAYAIVKYKLMSEVELVIEEIPVKPIDYKLESGYTYIVKEREPVKGFKLFAKAASEGSHGICITAKDPETIRNKYGLKRTPIIWITTKEDPREITINPREISSINELLKPFIDTSKNSVVILVDDHTITGGLRGVKSRHKILEISKNVFDTISHHNSRFIISSKPGSVTTSGIGSITKTRRPLLEFTRLASFVLEETCNDIIQHLINTGSISQDKLNEKLNVLRRRDTFFRDKTEINVVGNIYSTSETSKSFIKITTGLSKDIVIDKTKSFISVFEELSHIGDLHSKALKTLTFYGFSESEYLFHTGDTYIINESKGTYSFDIFREFIAKDYKGLCITKFNPQKVKRLYNFDDSIVKVFWLTDLTSDEKHIIFPKLENITAEIEKFIRMHGDKKIILLDGIEYLITYSGDMFESVLGSMRKLSDKISMSNACLIIPLNPKVISKERVSLLARSGIEIIKPPK